MTTNDTADGLVTAINEVGVIGAGQMGSGIAHVVALAGYNVTLNDLERQRFDDAVDVIRKNMTRQVSRGLIESDDAEKAISRISFGEDFKSFSQSDLVIEAATEDESIKRLIFKELCPELKSGRWLARTRRRSPSRDWRRRPTGPSSSSHSLHEPGAADAVVELIRGIATDDATFTLSRNFVETLGKTITSLKISRRSS